MSKKLVIFSWSLYDFANTIFAVNVISVYFALWVMIDKKAEDILYSFSLSTSILLAAILEPVMGAISDILKRRMPFLIFFTFSCAIFTIFLGFVETLFLGLLIFGMANFCYQLASVFYNSLLSKIASPQQIGKVSGYGVALGYLGTIFGLTVVRPFVKTYGVQGAFLPTGVFFILFSLPCFLFVKEENSRSFLKTNIRFQEGFQRIVERLRHIKRERDFFNFFLAAFFGLNAINTVIVFMVVYAKKVISMTEAHIFLFLIISTIFAILGSFASGIFSDRFGAHRVLKLVFICWLITLGIVFMSRNENIFWLVGPLGGLSLGSSWVVSRALLIELAPKEKIGESFGIFGMVGKASSIVGPLVWGGIIFLFRRWALLRYRLAVVGLLVFMSIGLFFLNKIKPSLKEGGSRCLF